MPSMRMSYVYVANMHMRVRVASMRTTEGSYHQAPRGCHGQTAMCISAISTGQKKTATDCASLASFPVKDRLLPPVKDRLLHRGIPAIRSQSSSLRPSANSARYIPPMLVCFVLLPSSSHSSSSRPAINQRFMRSLRVSNDRPLLPMVTDFLHGRGSPASQ